MTEQTRIRSVALFYFFSLLDDNLAKQAAIKTLAKIKRRLESGIGNKENISILVIQASYEVWKSFKKKYILNYGVVSNDKNFLLPPELDLGLWKEFSRKAEDDELLAVIWSEVLKFSANDIASGLNVTPGTVKHRINRGMRLLSETQK